MKKRALPTAAAAPPALRLRQLHGFRYKVRQSSIEGTQLSGLVSAGHDQVLDGAFWVEILP